MSEEKCSAPAGDSGQRIAYQHQCELDDIKRLWEVVRDRSAAGRLGECGTFLACVRHVRADDDSPPPAALVVARGVSAIVEGAIGAGGDEELKSSIAELAPALVLMLDETLMR